MASPDTRPISRKRLAPRGFVASQIYLGLDVRKLDTTLPHKFRPSNLDPRRCYYCTHEWDTSYHV